MLNNTRHHVKAMLNVIHLNKYTKVSLTYSSERLKSLVPHSNPGKTRTVIGIFVIEVYSLFQRSWRSPCAPLSTISVCIVVLVIIIIIFFVTLWNRYYDVWRETGSVLCRSVLWACWGSYRFLDKLLQSCPRNWIKISPLNSPMVQFVPKTVPWCKSLPQNSPNMPVVPQNSPLVQFVALNSPTVQFIALNRPMVQFIAFNSPMVHGLIVTLNSAMVQIVALNSPMMQFVALNSPIVQFVALNSPTVQFVPLNSPMMQFDTTLTQFHADTQNDQYPVKAVFVFPAMTLACIAVYV